MAYFALGQCKQKVPPGGKVYTLNIINKGISSNEKHFRVCAGGRWDIERGRI